MLVERHNEGDERTDDLNESSNNKSVKMRDSMKTGFSWQTQLSIENSQLFKLLRILLLRTS